MQLKMSSHMPISTRVLGATVAFAFKYYNNGTFTQVLYFKGKMVMRVRC